MQGNGSEGGACAVREPTGQYRPGRDERPPRDDGLSGNRSLHRRDMLEARLVSHLQPKNFVRHKERHLPTVVSGRRLGQSDPLCMVGEVVMVTKPPRFLEGTVSDRGSECRERTGGILLF